MLLKTHLAGSDCDLCSTNILNNTCSIILPLILAEDLGDRIMYKLFLPPYSNSSASYSLYISAIPEELEEMPYKQRQFLIHREPEKKQADGDNCLQNGPFGRESFSSWGFQISFSVVVSLNPKFY